ncbi:MAG: MscS Mechanosensitive ion channel [Candidatus Parvarchaeum acidiphilum ARMAN-4]|jgi:small-conductance mechanosensitive channel|uniref:MscS Mechanosensitive ion channel n=1 Tax=Candidatus Parvarchaeum acidiphilum ARMAN-4 TaxID=662760 RepID=D2EFE8_PARA4|nr:MAG: MscS Mechanosensitive ion channel [Candidatus Parvarchaeum acidiphilum ARMAN-4]
MNSKVNNRVYFIIFILVIFSVIAYAITLIPGIPNTINGIIDIFIILIGGVLIINFVSDIIEAKANNKNKQVSNTIVFVTRLAGYIIVIAIALSSFKIGITSVILGGGFVGVVVGLAAQASLSNFFSGIVLLFSKPFNIGDNITLSTWQYGLIAPSYPPKFFSNDFLVPGYTGVVEKMTLTFTTIRLDNNTPIKIPNSIVLQASIFINNEEYRNVKVRYEVPSSIDPSIFIKNVQNELKKLNFIKGQPEIFISETSFANKSNIFSVKSLCKSNSDDLPRSEIIKVLIKTSDSLVKLKRRK